MGIEFGILNFLYSLHNPFLDKIMCFITHLGDAGMVWIALSLVMCFVPKYRKAGITMLLALFINLVIGNITLKPLVARIRPYEYVDGIKLIIDTPTDFSFPSGHSFSSFAAATSLFLAHKKEGIFALISAAMIAFSRLYLYVHFPSDVFCGILFGIGVAIISRAIINYIYRRCGN